MRSRNWDLKRTLGTFSMLLEAIILCTVGLPTPANAVQQHSAGFNASINTGRNAAEQDAACARCHGNVVRSFDENPHVTQHRTTPGIAAVTCEDCHGPVEVHIESDGDASKIFNLAQASARQVNESCLKCHAGKHALFERSAHGAGNVSCIRCHSIHSAHESKHLLSKAQPELCFQCHDDQKAQFSERFRHKVVEGIILCSDCHEPHGGFGEQLQRNTTEQDFICTKCHTEISGPFKYEHDIVKTEGCIACHSPHGGPNPHMLNRARVNTICLLCHYPPQLSSTGESLVQAHDSTGKGQLCIDCHLDIHGSDVSAAFLKKK